MFMDAQQTHREGDIDEPNTPENREPITEVSDHARGFIPNIRASRRTQTTDLNEI